MRFIDTHAHLYLEEFEEDRDTMIQRAVEAGVEQFFLPNINSSTIEAMLHLEETYPERCFPMMGLHPSWVKEGFREELAVVKEWLDRRGFCAVGEIGIDLYWDKTHLAEQQEAFLTQIEWAKERDLPIVIHSRESIDLVINMLKEVRDSRLKGIFHCFGGSEAQAEAIIDLGFYLGIGGVLTFKKSGLDRVMESIDLSHVVLETDSPYLAPVPYRGKRNESAYVRLVAEKLATVKGTTVEEVARITTQNAERVFSLSRFAAVNQSPIRSK